MNDQQIVLKEYECLFESDSRLMAGEFDALEKFALDYLSQHKKDVLTLGYSRKKKEKYFKPTHYVGLLTLPGGLRIEILPKLFLTEKTEEAGEEETRNFFFTMLRTCGVIPSAPSSRGGLDRRHTDMLECFYAAFVEDVQRLVRQGLASGYHTQTDNQPFLKGRLELAGHIKYNAAHGERFYVTYNVFDQDRAENRLIKTALAGVQKKTLSQKLRVQAGRLLGDMDAIPLSLDPAEEFSRLVQDRSVARYKETLEWARLFLLHESFTTFSGTSATQAVLFPMEQVFEVYVAVELRRLLTPLGWEVEVQKSRSFFRKKDTAQESRPLRPDLVLRKDKRCFVMDTKWKDLNRKPVSSADLYQMYAYGKMYNAVRVTLLYPWSDGQEFTFISQEKDAPVTVDVKQFHVDRIKEELAPYIQELYLSSTKPNRVDGSPEV